MTTRRREKQANATGQTEVKQREKRHSGKTKQKFVNKPVKMRRS